MSKRKSNPSKSKERASKKAKGVTPKQEKLLKQLATREIRYAQFALENAIVVAAPTTTTAITNAYNLDPPVQSMSFVPLGDDINQRTGRKIAINNIRIHITLLWEQAVQLTLGLYNPSVRLILAIDQNCQGLVPNTTPDTRLLTANGFWSFMSNNAFGKYRVLMDKTYNSDTGIAVGTPNLSTFGGVKSFKMKHKFATPMIVNYNNNAAADVRQVIDNNLFIMGMSERALNPVRISYVARIAYTDL